VTSARTTLAVGGARHVPIPDPIARDYILLALRLDQHVPGLVDGFFGPADLKAQVDLGQVPSPAALAADATGLLERVEDEVSEPDRRRWLAAQLIGLRTHAAAAAGDELPYLEHVSRCFDWMPERRDESIFETAAGHLDRLLPGPEPLDARLAAWDRKFEVPVERLPDLVDWLVGRFRARAAKVFGLPAGEDLRVGLVAGKPWSGYNWYDGGLRSRVDINTDLPIKVADLIGLISHETFPGHHLEHAWKEADLVDGRGRLESSILLLNTPECLISEGLAELGREFVAPPDEDLDLLLEMFERGGLSIASDPHAARDAAERTIAIAGAREVLSETNINAAFLRHVDGASHDDTIAYLEGVGRAAPPLAAKRLDFIEQPISRTYVFAYDEGEALLRRWVEIVAPVERAARFGRLLHEQLTPSAISDEIDADSRRLGSTGGERTA
jgi:hypothetical protein